MDKTASGWCSFGLAKKEAFGREKSVRNSLSKKAARMDETFPPMEAHQNAKNFHARKDRKVAAAATYQVHACSTTRPAVGASSISTTSKRVSSGVATTGGS